jgi:PAS domain S-box-containing protein
LIDMPVDAAADGSALAPEIFRLAIEASPSGMVFVDGDGAIVLINREVERLFGYSREELLDRPVEILLPDKLRGRHANHRTGFRKHPAARHLGTGRDFLGRRKDGSEFPIEVGLNPMQIGGDVMVLCAIVDITERKRLERLHDEFITTVSHELRTPMTSIAGSLGLMIGGAAGRLPPSAAHLIEIAHANCRRLVRLVNDILDIKKLESGQMDFCFQRCAARMLVEQAIEANRGFADASGVRIRLDAAAGAFDVEVDPDRFVQVITNLLSNAIKFSPAGEEVVVTIETSGDNVSGDNVHVAVRDRGAGIPADFKPRIFEKFAQAKTVHGQQKSGTGLGLSIVRQIVMHMHGQVGFDDAPGGGTIFYVDLPGAGHFARWDAELAAGADSAPLSPDDEVRPAMAPAKA